ncbi:MAG: transporter [Acidobacteria bacterium]|nr:transporter [Acidobacteriota bacterium]
MAVALIALAAAPVAAQQTSVTAGVNVRFLSGTFGSDQTTDLLYAPAVLRLESGRFEAAAYFPYLAIDNGTVAPSQGGFVPMRGTLTNAPSAGMSMSSNASGTTGGMMGGGPVGGVNVPVGSSASPATSLVTNQSGLGDIVASAGYRIVDDAIAGVQVVLNGRIKVPTASATRGLGTGKADIGATGTIRKQVGGGWFYAEAGYLFIGDPDDVDLRNAALWGFGGVRRLTDRVSLLLSAYGNTALLAEFAAPIEAGAGVSIRAGRTTLTIVPTVGLSDASPRYAVNVGLSTDVFRR